jgi:hypothetical protein
MLGVTPGHTQHFHFSYNYGYCLDIIFIFAGENKKALDFLWQEFIESF